MNSHRITIALVLCLCVSERLTAFAGDEHQQMSAAAFHTAVAYVRSMNPALSGETAALLTRLEGTGDLSYADFVVSVDHRIDPMKILERPTETVAFPTSPEDLDAELSHDVMHPLFANLRAVSVNDMHFQGELTTNLRLFHILAIQLACYPNRGDASRPSLYTALMMNSVADHLLQDMFAPGHILTPRYSLHDAVALGMHNRFNILGAYFELRRDRIEAKLAPMFRFLPADLQASANSLLDSAAVPLWGDGDLDRSPRQKALVTLLTARSIADVLESYLRAVPVNSFRVVQFSASRIARFNGRWGLSAPEADLDYGYYRVPHYELVFPTVLGLTIFGSETLYQGGAQGSRSGIKADWLVFGVAHRFDRDGVLRARPLQFGVTVGWAYMRNHTQADFGPNLKVFVASPLIHTQLALEQGFYRYESRNGYPPAETFRRHPTSVHLQTGFSLIKFDFGVGRDYAFLHGDLKRAVSFSTGLYLEGPLMAVPGLKNIERALLIRQRYAHIPDRD